MNIADYIIFDFDGTIADTLELGIEIFNRIAPEYNCLPVGPEERELFRTKKPQELFEAYGISRLKLLTLMLRIRKEMRRHVSETKPFTGMDAALREISNSGYRMGILTSNSVENVRKFLEINNLSGLFEFINSGRSFMGKAKLIRKLLIHEQIPAGRVVYVGDETRDIEASRAAGIPVIAVSWGLNSRDLLASLSPDQIADSPEELPACVRQIFMASPQRVKASAPDHISPEYNDHQQTKLNS
jgi:HAD superfamily hydrolase (TIGR01549 family)